MRFISKGLRYDSAPGRDVMVQNVRNIRCRENRQGYGKQALAYARNLLNGKSSFVLHNTMFCVACFRFLQVVAMTCLSCFDGLYCMSVCASCRVKDGSKLRVIF